MIGSKRKVHIIFEALKAKGVDEKLLAAVHAPIGIDINAETPEEIALSIVSELVKDQRELNNERNRCDKKGTGGYRTILTGSKDRGLGTLILLRTDTT